MRVVPKPDKSTPVLEADGKTVSQVWYDYFGYLSAVNATAVSTTPPTDGQVLVFDSATGLYVPKSVGFSVPIRNVVAVSPGVSVANGGGGAVWNSIILPAGTGPWMVGCQTGVYGNSGSPVFSHMHADFGDGTTTIQTAPGDGTTMAFHITSNHSNGWIFPHMEHVWAYSASARTINAVATVDWTGGGTAVAYGTLEAVRVTFT